jgi:hypothetical protein
VQRLAAGQRDLDRFVCLVDHAANRRIPRVVSLKSTTPTGRPGSTAGDCRRGRWTNGGPSETARHQSAPDRCESPPMGSLPRSRLHVWSVQPAHLLNSKDYQVRLARLRRKKILTPL